MKRKKYLLEKVLVTDYAAEGKAFAKVDGKALFIEGAAPGDVVDVFVSSNKKDWAQGKAIRFHQWSSDRVTPVCRHFGVCGGCKWQMLPYEKQLQYKQTEAYQNLKRIGHVEAEEWLPILGADADYRYRNKLEFTFSSKRFLSEEEIKLLPNKEGVHAGGSAVGFHVPRIFDKVIDIETCHLMDEVNDAIRNTIREFAKQQDFSFYDIKQHTGWLRNIIIRHCTTGELMVNVCFGFEHEAHRIKLFDHLLARVPAITTLLFTINEKWNDSIYDLEPKAYFGKGFVLERLGSYVFKIGPKSFFQTNTRQAVKLYEIVRQFAGLTGKEVLYDLYCGTGSIGIFLSALAQKVIGVETIAAAIEDAKENAALNNIPHTSYFAGDVIDICNDVFFETHGRPDVVVTDPPRAGMHEKLVNKLLDIRAPKIVYVSCNTATQARDLATLSTAYSIKKIQPVDMFPHTHHIECVALLELKK